ncbi:hypothetical protein PR003_g18894 [Phytophthora rubi]|uniref:HTH CENPB-type domain-containing protein n=1 Tax=Phytophthora rubi TaxID=129364 RepID=A0A6A4E3W5_9STRA|nr:hypothetical protein PR001_g7536 [Phytophthora rubi]KAE9315813.1 hypothetical protein PR003_g18894 [Phytophthora rubi]
MRRGRQRVRGNGRQPTRFVHQAYSVAFKVEVLRHLDESQSMTATLDRYFSGISGMKKVSKAKLVYKWRRQRDSLEERARSGRLATQFRARPPGIGLTLPADVEQRILKWVNDFRREGFPISPMMLKMQACEFAKEAGIPPEHFSASWQWRRSFTRRHRLSFRAKTRHGQETPRDAELRAQEFANKVRHRAYIEGVTRIYNADQTGIFLDMLPKTTLASTNARTVWVKSSKKDKERITAMLLGDSDGNKYTPFVMLKSKPSKVPDVRAENERVRHGFGRHVWKEVEALQQQHDVQIYGNESAWWTGNMTMEFLRYHFGDRDLSSPRVMLLLDDFSGHWVDGVDEYARSLNILLEKVPPGLTWLSQPADAVWIKPMKDRLRGYRVHYLREQLQEFAVHADSETFKVKAPQRCTIVEWVVRAWEGLPRTTIAAGFRKCALTNAAGDPAGEELDEDPELQPLINNVVEQLEALDAFRVIDWEDIIDSAVV